MFCVVKLVINLLFGLFLIDIFQNVEKKLLNNVIVYYLCTQYYWQQKDENEFFKDCGNGIGRSRYEPYCCVMQWNYPEEIK